MSNLSDSIAPQAIAALLIEVGSHRGHVALPGSKVFNLAEFEQKENISIPGRVIISQNQTVRFGRDKSNEIMLDIANVSRLHAVFSATASGVRVSDLSSTNGTFVNGNPVTTPVKLSSGDTVEIGPAKIKVEMLSDLKTQTNIGLMGTEFDPVTTTGIVTILVADICNYTKMTETLPAEDMTRILQFWFEQCAKIIEDHGGRVDKYIGDCVMAFWRSTDMNAPFRAEDAVSAGIAIKEATRALSASDKWAYRDHADWDCRLSLNTGQVMMGKIGGRGARDFTVLGDVVNVAFRLNSVAGSRGYDFVLGNVTAKHVHKTIKVEKLGPIEVKGRNQKVVAFTLA